jgi:tRNA pseudouridine38-40 synthase
MNNEETQSAPALQTWKLTIAYDGTNFHGWQVQPGKATVQGVLQAALGRVTGEAPLPQGSGRTDAGVHALGQVASFTLAAPIPAANLHRALNRTLPPSVRILQAETMPDSFHARHSARAKTYEYRIFRDEICPPFLSRYALACPWPLDVEALREAARAFLGEHNFLSFAATDPDLTTRTLERDEELAREGTILPPPTVTGAMRTIYASIWEERHTEDGELLVYRVRGSGFLHHMVRNLVGTMLEVGRGRVRPDEMAQILAAHSRTAAGATAPAQGLILHSVEYEEPGPVGSTE